MSDVDNVNDEAEVAEELERIGKDDPDGLIQPEAVVEAARDESSALHRYFTWDDSDAAHQYRLAQARKLIAHVSITRIEQPPRNVNVRVKTSDGTIRRGYVSTERAVVEPDLFEQICADARRGIASYRARLSAFTQAKSVVDSLDDAIDGLRDIADEAGADGAP